MLPVLQSRKWRRQEPEVGTTLKSDPRQLMLLVKVLFKSPQPLRQGYLLENNMQETSASVPHDWQTIPS